MINPRSRIRIRIKVKMMMRDLRLRKDCESEESKKDKKKNGRKCVGIMHNGWEHGDNFGEYSRGVVLNR